MKNAEPPRTPMCPGRFILPWMASRHMPSEPQEVISKKTIMKEAEKPGQGRWPCAVAAAKGGGEQGDPAGVAGRSM